MCGRFDTTGMSWSEIYEALKQFGRVTTDVSVEDWAAGQSADVRPTSSQLTVRLDGGAWVLERMRWGLIPFWRGGKPVKDTAKGAGDGFKLTTFNARIEGVESSAVFKAAFARRRCLIPATGWYEWTEEQGGKVKHRFARQDGRPIWFAGIWDRCQTADQGEVASFTLLTGPSAGWLSDYHSRAPVILDPADWAVWLDPATDARPLMAAVRPERFAVIEGQIEPPVES